MPAQIQKEASAFPQRSRSAPLYTEALSKPGGDLVAVVLDMKPYPKQLAMVPDFSGYRTADMRIAINWNDDFREALLSVLYLKIRDVCEHPERFIQDRWAPDTRELFVKDCRVFLMAMDSSLDASKKGLNILESGIEILPFLARVWREAFLEKNTAFSIADLLYLFEQPPEVMLRATAVYTEFQGGDLRWLEQLYFFYPDPIEKVNKSNTSLHTFFEHLLWGKTAWEHFSFLEQDYPSLHRELRALLAPWTDPIPKP